MSTRILRNVLAGACLPDALSLAVLRESSWAFQKFRVEKRRRSPYGISHLPAGIAWALQRWSARPAGLSPRVLGAAEGCRDMLLDWHLSMSRSMAGEWIVRSS